jgi:hypothetical protein
VKTKLLGMAFLYACISRALCALNGGRGLVVELGPTTRHDEIIDNLESVEEMSEVEEEVDLYVWVLIVLATT